MSQALTVKVKDTHRNLGSLALLEAYRDQLRAEIARVEEQMRAVEFAAQSRITQTD